MYFKYTVKHTFSRTSMLYELFFVMIKIKTMLPCLDVSIEAFDRLSSCIREFATNEQT